MIKNHFFRAADFTQTDAVLSQVCRDPIVKNLDLALHRVVAQVAYHKAAVMRDLIGAAVLEMKCGFGIDLRVVGVGVRVCGCAVGHVRDPRPCGRRQRQRQDQRRKKPFLCHFVPSSCFNFSRIYKLFTFSIVPRRPRQGNAITGCGDCWFWKFFCFTFLPYGRILYTAFTAGGAPCAFVSS